MRALQHAVAIGTVLLLLGTGSCAPGAGSGTSGPSAAPALGAIEGTVTAGPVCPVERQPPASACADRAVVGARIRILDSAGRDVTVAVSGADGSFAITVPPGSYRLVPQPVAGLLGTAPAQEVRVDSGSAARVDVQYDTGIR